MRSLVNYINSLIFPLLPETRGFGIKRALLRLAGATVGANVRICSSAKFIGSGRLEIGDNTWIGHNCLISATSLVKIGADCDLAPMVFIGNGTHEITTDRARIADIEISRDTVVGNGCWLGVRSTILPGVTIADRTVVAAGAVVTKSFSESSVLLAGIPAQIKKVL